MQVVRQSQRAGKYFMVSQLVMECSFAATVKARPLQYCEPKYGNWCEEGWDQT